MGNLHAKPLKFDLTSLAGVSSYRAHFRGVFHQLLMSESLSDKEWMTKTANLLTSWCLAEPYLFSADSTRLRDIVINKD